MSNTVIQYYYKRTKDASLNYFLSSSYVGLKNFSSTFKYIKKSSIEVLKTNLKRTGCFFIVPKRCIQTKKM